MSNLKKLIVKEDFLDLFEKIHEYENFDNNGSNAIVLMLPLENNSFCYDELIEELTILLPNFVFSEKNLNDFRHSNLAYKSAKEKLIEYSKLISNNEKTISEEDCKNYHNGELGEFLLFGFLESHLKAPKIFSKYEHKTNGNMPIHGSDGVHLLKNNDNEFELIFGESKMNKDIKVSMSSAFSSIEDFKSRRKDNMHSEILMLASNLNREVSEEQEKFLKELLIPKRRLKTQLVKNHSFGIFWGFEVSCNLDKNVCSKDYSNSVKELIKNDVQKNMNEIHNLIKKHQLEGHKLYIYTLPFENLQLDRNILPQQL